MCFKKLVILTMLIKFSKQFNINFLFLVIKEELISRCCKFGKLIKCVLPTEGKGKGIVSKTFFISSMSKFNH